MSLTVEVAPEIEENVVREAARRGVEPSNLVAEVLGRAHSTAAECAQH